MLVYPYTQENLDLRTSLGLYHEFMAILGLYRENKASNGSLMVAQSLCGSNSLPWACQDLEAPGGVCVVFPERVTWGDQTRLTDECIIPQAVVPGKHQSLFPGCIPRCDRPAHTPVTSCSAPWWTVSLTLWAKSNIFSHVVSDRYLVTATSFKELIF